MTLQNRSLYFLPKLTMSILDWFHGLTVAVTFTDHILLIRVFWALALCLIRCNNHVCHHKESSIFLRHKEFIVSRNAVYQFFAIKAKSTKFFFPPFLALFCSKKYPYSFPQRFIGLNSPIPSENSSLVSLFFLLKLAFKTSLPYQIFTDPPWSRYREMETHFCRHRQIREQKYEKKKQKTAEKF